MLTNGSETDGHVHEVTHDKIHKSLHIIDPETFTVGNGTDFFALCREILQCKSFVLKHNYICSQCDELIELSRPFPDKAGMEDKGLGM